MANADENVGFWHALHEKLEVRGDDQTSCPRPSAAELDRFEAESGMRLPAGYRGFLQVFGPGLLKASRNDVLVYAPGCRNRTYNLEQFLEQTARLRSLHGLSDRVKRLRYFARDFTQGAFGWDPDEATDAGAPEFVIYALYRGEDEANQMARSFSGFIKVCLDSTAFLKHQSKGTYTEYADESDFSFLDALSKRKVFERARASG